MWPPEPPKGTAASLSVHADMTELESPEQAASKPKKEKATSERMTDPSSGSPVIS
jgi:hypothetical protein